MMTDYYNELNKIELPVNKYRRKVKMGVYIDSDDVLMAFDVFCPAMQDAVKKILNCDCTNDRQCKLDAIESIKRSIELNDII